MNLAQACTVSVLFLGLGACQALPPVPSLAPPQEPATRSQGSLNVSIRWPQRELQTIPLSTEIIRLRVSKGGTLITEVPIGRPEATDSALVSQATVHLDAGTGFTVKAEAFRVSPVTEGAVAIAAATVTGMTIIASQQNPVILNLAPVFVPTLTGVSPTNGGPGIPVTLTGAFSNSGSYGLRLGALTSTAASGSGLTASIPAGALSGPLVALDDGVPSASGTVFSVLARLDVSPASASTAIDSVLQFSVPTGLDTGGLTISMPTVTRWALLDPTRFNLPGSATSNIGSLSQSGLFTAQATGSAWLYVFSGGLAATAAITVK